jgi:hypothetical protein
MKGEGTVFRRLGKIKKIDMFVVKFFRVICRIKEDRKGVTAGTQGRGET